MTSVDHGHEAEVNAEIGAALLAALRTWREEGEARAARPGMDVEGHDDGSDEEVA